MNFSQFRKARERRERIEPAIKERRPRLSSQEERFLYSMHLKTIELRTLMSTLRAIMPREEFNELMVEYAIRLRKAKKNFEDNNWKDEWYEPDRKNIESGV